MGSNGTLTLTCDAFPVPIVKWFFNDTELKNTPKHKIESKPGIFSLIVNKCDNGDVGQYRAVIDNGIDKTEQTAKLSVGGELKCLSTRYISFFDFLSSIF